ncbi:signal peptidase [Flavobacterium sp. SUN052]|uniref:signal peptidase n=1 Tax=Flavobacterium sp. SUN052 TaxID=3002441 RepID=UPI00237D4D2B|nr:signal peptidase [Flavobacterium sp. SUN052]MEC4005430.1 signal peptidase [Flavobacterium sp. SUN052]
MKNLIKICLFSFFLLSDFVMFAQPGDEDDNGGGGLEGTDPAPAPINSKIIILVIIGLVFAFYKLKNIPKKA